MAEMFHLEGGVPKYIQISNWLTEMIRKGRYAAQDKLPSESNLAELFRVNRNTVRQAIADLVAKGLIQKKNGVGSFVLGGSLQPVKYTLQHISSFTDEMHRMGLVPQTKLLHKSVIKAPPEVSHKLMLERKNRSFGPSASVSAVESLWFSKKAICPTENSKTFLRCGSQAPSTTC